MTRNGNSPEQADRGAKHVHVRPGMGIVEAEKGRDRVAEEGAAQVADEEHPHAAVFIGARRGLAADEPIDEVVQPDRNTSCPSQHPTASENLVLQW